jgi:hypothetical protein
MPPGEEARNTFNRIPLLDIEPAAMKHRSRRKSAANEIKKSIL